MLSHRQRALLSAAARHVRDAERLLADGSSPDQAWHLAGFGPECARKACIDDAVLDRALGHELGPDGEALLDWWIPLDPHAWRYDLADWSTAEPGIADWRPESRYEQTGTRSGIPVEALVGSARRLVDRVIADLWSDGWLSEGNP